MELSIFEILEYFVVYSFLGWIMESIFRSFCEKKLINTGFLHGPICPIYGIGAIIMIVLLSYFDSQIILLFIASLVLMTLWEYAVGVLLEKIFKTKYWDYSDHKINFQGRICLSNSIMWGVLGVLFINFIHPGILQVLSNINIIVMKEIIYISLVLIVIDAISTITVVKNIGKAMETIDKLSNEIKFRVEEMKLAKKLKEDVKVKDENIEIIVKQLKRRQKRIAINIYRTANRLKKAFPTIDSKEISEILSKRFEKKKKKIVETADK